MKPDMIKNTIKYLLAVLYILFIIITFIVANQRSNFWTVHNLIIFTLEILNLLAIFWMVYNISEMDLFHQGKIGKGILYICFGLILAVLRSFILTLGNLQILYVQDLGSFLSIPLIVAIWQTFIIIFLIIGIMNIAQLYRDDKYR